jgi:hypothetical protein
LGDGKDTTGLRKVAGVTSASVLAIALKNEHLKTSESG